MTEDYRSTYPFWDAQQKFLKALDENCFQGKHQADEEGYCILCKKDLI